MRAVIVVYGVACYVAFLAVFIALALFAWNAGCVRGIDAAPAGSLAIDVGLVALFGVSHSVLARPAAKRVVTAIVTPATERSTYVLVASASLALLIWQWRADPTIVWHVVTPAARAVVWAVAAGGAALIVGSTFLTDHFDLFGLRQVWMSAYVFIGVAFEERGLARTLGAPYEDYRRRVPAFFPRR